MAKFCKNCGAQVEEGAGFCPGCGAAMEGQPVQGYAPPPAQPQYAPPPAQPQYAPPPAQPQYAPPPAQPQYAPPPAQPQYAPPPAQPQYAPQKKPPKWLWIAIIAAAAVVALLLIMNLAGGGDAGRDGPGASGPSAGDMSDPVDDGDTDDPADAGDADDPASAGDTDDPVGVGDTEDLSGDASGGAGGGDAPGLDGYYTGVVCVGEFYHDGRDETITYYYTDLGRAQYDKLASELGGVENYSGQEVETEIHIYTLIENLSLKDYVGSELTFKGDFFEADNMNHMRNIVFEIKEIKGVTDGQP
ncbi:MAG: zinc ribbon domain-containing protein [Clostridiales bacterium]|nr:zinc ribbon domain-containing protein [Clostridiales bacterium]